MTHPTRRQFAAATAASAATLAAAGVAGAQEPSPGRSDGKVVLITGGTSGIGRATAEAWAAEGAKVVFCGRRETLGAEVEAGIRGAGGEASYVRADVNEEEDVRRLVGRTLDLHGRLDVAFNNAGIDRPPAPIAELATDVFDEQIRTNLRGVFLCMKHEMPHLVESRGSLINMASIGGVHAFPNIIAYAASKAAVIQMTMCASQEYGGQVRCNAVAPGAIDTPMLDRVREQWDVTSEQLASSYPAKRLGTAAEVAAVVMWLASDEARYVGGQVVGIDGGGLP